jgi:hypothetical protein
MVSSKVNSAAMGRFQLLWILLLIFGFIGSCDELGIGNEKDSNNNALFPVKVNNQYGFIDQTGRMVIEPKFQFAYAFSEGLAAVRFSNRWHFIDDEGDIEIDGMGSFQELRSFKNGLAPIRIQGRWGFINTRGEVVINPRFRSVTSFSEDRSFVRSLDFRNWFYINKEGVELKADLAANGMDEHENTDFKNGRALVKDQNMYGYLNDKIETVIPINYADAKVFSDNLAAVKISDRWAYISTDGSIALNPQYIAANVFSQGMAAVRQASNSFGYINTDGKMVISEQFDEAMTFSEDRAVVRLNDRYGVIDKTGNWIVEPTYEQIDNYENGLAKIYRTIVLENQNTDIWFGYINREGKIVWVPSN